MILYKKVLFKKEFTKPCSLKRDPIIYSLIHKI